MRDITGAKALLVEDMALLLLDLEEMATQLGLDVVARASTVEDGISCAQSHVLDVAILDVDLGGQRSTPVADVLAGLSVPFIFVTGFADAELPARFRQAPRVPKPFTASQLGEALAAVILEPLGRRPERLALHPSPGHRPGASSGDRDV